jgi:hypothetical protein
MPIAALPDINRRAKPRNGVGPGALDPAVEVGHHTATVEVGLDRSKLQLAAAEGRIGLAPVF